MGQILEKLKLGVNMGHYQPNLDSKFLPSWSAVIYSDEILEFPWVLLKYQIGLEYVWKKITLCLNLAFSLQFQTQTWHLWYSGFIHFYFNVTFFLITSMNPTVLGLFLTKPIGFNLGLFTSTLVWINLCKRNHTGHKFWFSSK